MEMDRSMCEVFWWGHARAKVHLAACFQSRRRDATRGMDSVVDTYKFDLGRPSLSEAQGLEAQPATRWYHFRLRRTDGS
jgi:hypothetical protein